ncbi:MAG: ABC transporter substrate-binding protein [Rhodospirillales bacterium]|nr:ABC transporter substrate-binding protein [Rhodospirillales bacterium]
MTRISPRLATAMVALVLGCAAPAVQAQNLTIAVGGNITSMDPHFHNLGPNNNIAQYFFDRLVHFDHQQRPIPGLAESWRAIDDKTWEFKLRKGVKFHDGSDFDAQDVLATFKRTPWVPNSPSSFTAMVRGVDVTVVDPHTLIFKTAAPRPLLPLDMAIVNIVNRKNVEAPTAEFNAGRAMLGTGPFKFKEFVPGDRVAMERNDAYWGTKSPWSTVTTRIVTNSSARTAALLSGDVQIIDQVQTADIPRLRQNANLRIESVTSNRLIYLHLDHNRDVTPFAFDKASGQPLAKNPLKDLRVRQALSKAINRQAIAERVFDGQAIPAGGLLPDGFFGASPKLKPDALDAAAAQNLLRAAGFPNGFKLTIHGPNDRYPEDDKVLQAIGPMFTRVGIETAVQPMPWSTYVAQAGAPNYSFSVMLVGWGSDTGETSSPIRALLATPNRDLGYGASNRGRYSNPKVDELLGKALQTVDTGAREKLLYEASEIGVGDLGLIPLYYQVNLWAMRSNVTYQARSDEYTLAHQVKPR